MTQSGIKPPLPGMLSVGHGGGALQKSQIGIIGINGNELSEMDLASQISAPFYVGARGFSLKSIANIDAQSIPDFEDQDQIS